MARTFVVLAVLVAIAIPVGAPWGHGVVPSEPAAAAGVAPPTALPASIAKPMPAAASVTPPAAKVAAADACAHAVLVTVSGRVRTPTAERTIDLAGLGIHDGAIDANVAGVALGTPAPADA